MRILVIVNVFHPDRGGGASVFSDMCAGLVERGHDVEVWTAHPYYPEWTNKSGANLWRRTWETWQGVRLRRHGLYIPSRPGSLLQRMIYEASFFLSLCRSIAGGPRRDLVMVYCPLIGAVLAAVIRKALRREPLWLNVQDVPADAAAAAGISRSGFFDRAAAAVQRWLFRRADVVSTISPVMRRRVAAIVGSRREVVEFPNWLNASMLGEIRRVAAGRAGRGRPPGPVRLLYAGNVGRKQGLLEFCRELAGTVSEFAFRIHAGGGEAAALRAWVEAAGDPRFHCGDFLPESEFVEELHRADWFVITERSAGGASFIPSKLIPCIASGTPVIAVCDPAGPLGIEVEAHRLGAVVPWGDIDPVVRLLREVPPGSSRHEAMRLACRRRAEAFTREAALRHFESVAGALCGAPAGSEPVLPRSEAARP